MPGTYSQLLLHIVFSTKHRDPWIVPEVAERLYPYMGGIIRAEKGVLYDIGGAADHVHLYLRGRADGRFGTELLPRRRRPTSPFLAHVCESKVANAFVWPIFSAFRALLEETSAGAVRFVDDPFVMFEEKKNELVSAVQDFHRSQGNIQMVGKNTEIWVRLESKILAELDIRRRMGTPPHPLPPWPSCPVPDPAGDSSGSGQATGPGGDSELSFVNEPQFKFAHNVTDRFLFVLAWACRRHPDRFSRVCDEVHGTQRVYFARSADDIEQSGISTNPKQIPGTPYWVSTNRCSADKNEILVRVLCDVLGYDRDAVRCALRC